MTISTVNNLLSLQVLPASVETNYIQTGGMGSECKNTIETPSCLAPSESRSLPTANENSVEFLLKLLLGMLLPDDKIGSKNAYCSGVPPDNGLRAENCTCQASRPVDFSALRSDNLVSYGSQYQPGSDPEKRSNDIISGFRQGNGTQNCVTISAIKAAMQKFGTDPEDIFSHVAKTSGGYDITMRDGFVLHLTHAELRQSTNSAGLVGGDRQLVRNANFLYAASVKRAHFENNDGHARRSFSHALLSVNDRENAGEGLKRLGLKNHMRTVHVHALANGMTGTVLRNGHDVAVINGREEIYGRQGKIPGHGYAIALT
jgi:hypothetical protein